MFYFITNFYIIFYSWHSKHIDCATHFQRNLALHDIVGRHTLYLRNSKGSNCMPRLVPKPLPTLKHLHECFILDTNRGVLTWRDRPREHFVSHRVWLAWNTRYAGTIAGSFDKSIGYRKVIVFDTTYKVARIVYKMHYETEPPIVDHKNLDKTDNGVKNLRASDEITNTWNHPIRKNNKFGTKGYHWFKKAQKYKAEITHNGTRIYLGLFTTEQEARSAYELAEFKLRGEFVRLLA